MPFYQSMTRFAALTFIASSGFMLSACMGDPSKDEPSLVSSESSVTQSTISSSNQNTLSSVNNVSSSSNMAVSSNGAMSSAVASSVNTVASSVNTIASSVNTIASSVNTIASSMAASSEPQVVVVAIPGRVQAQDYINAKDDAERQGDTQGACSQGVVDMKAVDDNGGICKIGWTQPGEWVEYELVSNSDGDFDLLLRVASQEGNKRILITVDGVEYGQVFGPGKGFDSFANAKLSNVAISAGEHTLRLTFLDGGIDLNYVDVVEHVPAASSASASSTPANPKDDTPSSAHPKGNVLDTGKFIHPGLFSTKGQLDYVKDKIKAGKQPWKGAFEKLEATKPHTRKVNARALVKTEPDKPGSSSANRKAMDEMTRDGSAAYAASLLWFFTGDDKYRKFAVDTLNAWSIYKSGGMPLYHTWMVPHFLNAAEIMAHTPGSGWKDNDIKKFKAMVSANWWQPVRLPPKEDSNHAGTATESQLAIAIFTDDVKRFKEAMANQESIMHKFVYLNEKGRLDGETANTCRDITHVKLGTHGLMYGAEYLWNQNIDVWTKEKKRWAIFAEFHAGIMDDTNPSKSVCGWKGAARQGVVYCAGATGKLEPPCQQVPWHILINQVGNRLDNSLPLTRAMAKDRYMGQITHRNTKWETLLKANVPSHVK